MVRTPIAVGTRQPAGHKETAPTGMLDNPLQEYPPSACALDWCKLRPIMNKQNLLLVALLTGLLTFALYSYHEAQAPDQEQIDRCNELVEQMPENTREEINRNINTFLECLED